MARQSTVLLLLLFFIAFFAASSVTADLHWGLTSFDIHEAASPVCNGLSGECAADDLDEANILPEVTRRGLSSRTRFISYDALKRDRVPCGRRGTSYYNCNNRRRINPYRRGCSAITRCASHISPRADHVVSPQPQDSCRFVDSSRIPSQNINSVGVTVKQPLKYPFLKSFYHHPCEGFVLPPPPADKKRTGPRPCPVCYLPVEQAMASMPTSPSLSPVLKRLNYATEDNLVQNKSGGSAFGGYPSLQQRNEYFDIKEAMTVHCGFVKGEIPGHNTGFDFDNVDRHEMEQCHGVVVASAIFGNYDTIKQPKNISEATKRRACFFMFVDEETEASIKNTTTLDNRRKVGLWRVVVIQNLPYADPRRTGKVPKLLNHRFFPNAQYSIWIDGKLELVEDPYRLLERFLWRVNKTFAISKHYSRPDVFLEGEANIKAKKYDNTSIYNQLEFYKSEGLTPYSQAKLPIESDVPEGCVIIRALTPITNLFTCLWFNEVDRFTPRDQLSFATVRNKIMARVDWSPHMFQDCERRNFVNQAYHTDVMKEMALPLPPPPPPPVVTSKLPRKTLRQKSLLSEGKKLPARPDRHRKAGPRGGKI
ncbi:probable hexosyltransferase MUCI70 [Typha latifolia]|uniref:probable hexosyltransferase MUCI70 n=1 Tax=Typha latifolia TaxID=4733 RepID=UPI003C2C877E